MPKLMSVTCTGPVNIAVVKYWGKRDEDLVLPVNSSLSITLDQAQMRSKTTVCASKDFKSDKMWLNGQEQSLSSSRLERVLNEVRRRARKRKRGEDNRHNICDWHLHICSENNFPTAAGLASSAAGFACLVFSLAKLFGIEGDVSEIARLGSGSACRSMYGGFVAWDMGVSQDGTDSIARQIAPESHWADLRVLVLVVSGNQKHTGSTSGMQTSVQTSQLLQHRIKLIPERMQTLTDSIKNMEYQTFAEETMKDSNQMHAVCLDTYPPIAYMTDTSHAIIRMIHAINRFYGKTKVCYTFDAGPNACLYLPQSSIGTVMSVVNHFFPPADDVQSFIRGIPVEDCTPDKDLLNTVSLQPAIGAIKYVISTKVGPGPQLLDDSESLLDQSGLPVNNKC